MCSYSSSGKARNLLRRFLFFAFFTLCLNTHALPAWTAELVMFERQGCPYCIAWDREIGKVYALTDEGKRLKLRRVDIAGERPDDLRLVGEIRLTPTFLVMDQGREVGRILGYSGEDMFWGLLDQIIARLSQPTSP
jgi:thioredoxin-related protein